MAAQPKRYLLIEFGRFVEIMGIIGILGSLSFLGYELKRSNELTEANAISDIYNMTNQMGLAMARDPELRRVFALAQSDFESLSSEDLFTLYVLIEHVINSTESAWKYYDKRIINAEEAEYFTQGLCRLIQMHPDMEVAWRENESNRIPGFYGYVNRVCGL